MEHILGVRYLLSVHWRNEQEHQRPATDRQLEGAASEESKGTMQTIRLVVEVAVQLVRIDETAPHPPVPFFGPPPPSS